MEFFINPVLQFWADTFSLVPNHDLNPLLFTPPFNPGTDKYLTIWLSVLDAVLDKILNSSLD